MVAKIGTAEPLTVPAHWRPATKTTRRSRRVQSTSLILVPADRQPTALGARVGDSLIGATMVAPGVEKYGEVARASRLVDGSNGSGRGVRRGRRSSGCGRRGSSLTVGGG